MAFLSSFYPQPVVKGTTAGTFAEGNDPRLSDARTPLSHSSTHHTGGTDAIAPSSIGAQTLFTSTTLNLNANTTLTAARATNYSIINSGNHTITLPTTGHLVGDIVVVGYVAGTGTLNVTWGAGGQSIALNAQYRFIATGTGATNWALVNVDTHTHGNISNTGTIGSTAGLPVVTTTSGAISTLALGTANQVLRVNSEATGVEFGAGFDAASPPAIGSTTPSSGAFTTLSAAPTSGSALTLTGGTVTASAPLIDASQTWNNSGVTFTGLRLNATNTASASASLLMDLQTGGTTQFSVRRDGAVNAALQYNIAGVAAVSRGAGFNLLHAGCIVGWGGTGFNVANTDLTVERDAADTLAQRRAANAQTFRLYTTIGGTGNADFERLFIRGQTGGAFQIGTEKGGTGAARALELSVDGNRRIFITASGQVGIGSTTGSLASHGLFVDVPASNSTLTSGGVTIRGTTSVTLDNGGDPILRVQSSRVMFGGTTNLFPALKRSSTTLQVRLADDSDFAPLACAGLTLNGDLTASTRNIATDTTTGTKIGTATNQKIGFFDKTPVVQPTAVADATDAATVITQLNALLSRMRDLGLIAT